MSPSPDGGADGRHPRDRWITVYGRKPVQEALEAQGLHYGELLVDRGIRGGLDELLRAAKARGVEARRVPLERVNRRSRNARQDQGVALDVAAPRMQDLAAWLEGLEGGAAVLILDGVTTPANVGMVLRSAVAAGLDGIVLPRHGAAGLGPLVIKASAGLAFSAPVLKCDRVEEALDALGAAGFERFGLAGEGSQGLFELGLPRRSAWVLGNESEGISAGARARVDRLVRIPMAEGVESLNVACAATLVAFVAGGRAVGRA